MRAFESYNLEKWKPKVGQLLQDVEEYLSQAMQGEGTVLAPNSITELSSFFKNAGSKLNPSEAFKEILKSSNHLHHPGYAGHQVVPPTIPSILAGAISNVLNQGMAVSDMGQSATAVERAVVTHLLEAYNWPEGEGIMTSGGSLGNLTALLSARQRMGNMWEEGNAQDCVVLVSSDAHYCVDRAVRIMGFGANGVVKMKPNANRQIDGEILNTYVAEQKALDKKILAVVGSACSTGPGVFDNIKEMAAVCREEDLWFHVDAAHGGMLKLSETYSHLLEGTELADSVVIDFHKMGFTPALTTALLYRNGIDSFRPFQQEASYLWAGDEEPWTQSGLRTVECTKFMMGLRAYANLFWLPEGELPSMMDCLIDSAKSFAVWASDQKNWELLCAPAANIVCFRFKGASEKAQRQALTNLVASGKYYIVSTVIDGAHYFRITVMNVRTELKHLQEMLQLLERELKSL